MTGNILLIGKKKTKMIFLLTEIIEQSQLMNYLNDKVKIKNGDYTLSDGRVVSIDNSNNTWYSHPEEFREDILETYKLPYQDILIVQDKI